MWSIMGLILMPSAGEHTFQYAEWQQRMRSNIHPSPQHLEHYIQERQSCVQIPLGNSNINIALLLIHFCLQTTRQAFAVTLQRQETTDYRRKSIATSCLAYNLFASTTQFKLWQESAFELKTY